MALADSSMRTAKKNKEYGKMASLSWKCRLKPSLPIKINLQNNRTGRRLQEKKSPKIKLFLMKVSMRVKVKGKDKVLTQPNSKTARKIRQKVAIRHLSILSSPLPRRSE